MRRVTRRTTLHLQRSMFERKRSLLVRVTLQTACVGAGCETRLLELETTVRIMTIAALDQTFEHLVMKGPAKLRFRFAVTTDAELRLASFEHVRRQQIAISSRRFGNQRV